MDLNQLATNSGEWVSESIKWLSDNVSSETQRTAASGLINWVTNLFKSHRQAKEALDKLRQNPDDQLQKGKLEVYLLTALEANQATLQELSALLAKLETAEKASPTVYKKSNNTITGNQNTIISDTNNSDISIGRDKPL